MVYNFTDRTFNFSKAVIFYCNHIPNTISGKNIAYQLVRSGTSVGANYRAARRARSDREFIAKMNIVLEEADESLFWLEIINDTKIIQSPETTKLMKEAEELVAISVTMLRKTNKRVKK